MIKINKVYKIDCLIGMQFIQDKSIACINTNRNFIGFELNKDYYNICVERIKNRNKLNG